MKILAVTIETDEGTMRLDEEGVYNDIGKPTNVLLERWFGRYMSAFRRMWGMEKGEKFSLMLHAKEFGEVEE